LVHRTVQVTNEDKPRLLLDSLVLGIIGGVSAQVFTWMLRASQKLFLGWMAGYTPPGVPDRLGEYLSPAAAASATAA